MSGVAVWMAGCYASHTRSSESDGGSPREEARGLCIVPLPPCEIDADCGPTPPWACRAGRCTLIGCQRDEECPAERSACVRSDGVGQCQQRCRRTEDCALVGGFTGPDECREGLCQPAGCPSAEYCREYAGRGHWRCEPNPGSLTSPGLPVCREICERDTDCAGWPIACVAGYCSPARCRSDEECRARFDDERFECLPRT